VSFYFDLLLPFFLSPDFPVDLLAPQGIGAVKDSLPPVPEDKEIRAKNRARNEEQKKVKEGKKAKAARRAERREVASKNRREAEKAGVAPPPSPETQSRR